MLAARLSGRRTAISPQIHALFTRRPALPAAILFVVGISLHPLLPGCPACMVGISALLVTLAVIRFNHSGISSAAIALAILLAGAAAGLLAAYYFPTDHIAGFATEEPRLGAVEGQIVETPRTIDPEPGGHPLPEKQAIMLRVRAIKSWNGWIPASGKMPVTISPAGENLAAGEVVRLLGQIERPQPAMNPGGFDSAEHERRERVLVSMHVSRPYDVQILSAGAAVQSPLPGMRAWARGLLDRGFPSAEGADRSLLRALVFGDREPALRDVQDDFTHTGTAHLLAANGSRIAILAGAIFLLCRVLRLPPRATLGALTASVTLFGFLTMPAAEALRPAVICAAVGFGTLGRRSIDSLQLLALVALALLAVRPLDLYAPGFQLSFVIVLGMIVFTPRVLKMLEGWENPDRKVADSFTRPTAARRALRWARLWLVRAVVAGAVAWIVALPLVAYHFEQLNLWTVPFGIVLSPLAMLALAGGFLKMLLTAICPMAAGAWAAAADVPAAALRHAVHGLAGMPWADLPLSRPSVGAILLYYAMLALPLLSWRRPRLRWCARCAPVGGCAMLVMLPLLSGIGPPHGPGARAIRITLLWVGAGQCAVVEPAGGGVALLDAGSSTLSDPLRTCIEPFLRHEQRRSIDRLFLSHGDYDHISAAQRLVPEYDVREVLTSAQFRRHAPESKPCEALLRALDRTGHSPHLVAAGDRFQIGRDAQVQVLWPPAGCTMNSNNAGVVLRLTCAGRSILFPADIQEPAELELLKNPEQLRSDILVAPHHGSRESSTARFIAAVHPQLILASSDERLTTKQRLFDGEVGNLPLFRTSRHGALTLEIDDDGTFRILPCRPPPGWTPPPGGG